MCFLGLIPMMMVFLASAVNAGSPPRLHTLEWHELPMLPNREGVAAPFAGVDDDALLVAGGANFPGKKPWEGGTKVWHDSVYVLERPDGHWKKAGKLPRPLAYGVSITTNEGVVCIGGSDANRHYAECFQMQWREGELRISSLPSLPVPCANAAGVMLNRTIYVAGGISGPNEKTALHTLWSLNIENPTSGWCRLDAWPGPGRMLAVAGALHDSLFLFGGTALECGPEDQPVRKPLIDAYRYAPSCGWKRIADVPVPITAAPSPAPALGQTQLLVLGGDDHSQVNVSHEKHIGFCRQTLAYEVELDIWTALGDRPFAFVTTPTTHWAGRIVVPGGEIGPGIRSNRVWAAK